MHNALQRSAMLCYSVTIVLLNARECSGGDSKCKFQGTLRNDEKGSRAGAGAAHGQRLGHGVRECGEQPPRRRTLCAPRAFLRRTGRLVQPERVWAALTPDFARCTWGSYN